MDRVRPHFEVCFFPEPGSFVRIRDGEDGMFTYARQVTYRCGMCGQPVVENELDAHQTEHRRIWMAEMDLTKAASKGS